jgi:hypothetical protein
VFTWYGTNQSLDADTVPAALQKDPDSNDHIDFKPKDDIPVNYQ